MALTTAAAGTAAIAQGAGPPMTFARFARHDERPGAGGGIGMGLGIGVSTDFLLPARQSRAISHAARRPHICFVAPNIWPAFSGSADAMLVGGAEVQQSILARALARDGFPVSIICNDFGQPAHQVCDGITLVKTFRPDEGLPVLRFIHPRLTSVWRALRRVNADIYYQRTASMLTAVVASFCHHHGKLAIYAGASDMDFIPGRQDIRFRRDRWLFERGLAAVDAVVVQNLAQKELCAKNYGREATLIPSCYELPTVCRYGEDKSTTADDYVLWVAAIRRGKRPELLLEMIRRLPQRRFLMIGGPASATLADRDYFEKVRHEARQLPNVEFLGFMPMPQTEAYFDRARIVINTSAAHDEGMPNVFLQAWARGIPTVAFFDAMARRNGESIYPVVGDLEEATLAVERLCADDVYHAKTSRRCLDYFAATHTRDSVLAQYQQLLQKLWRGNRT